jgi:ribonuclease Z
MVDVVLLGCGGMMPLPHRSLTSLLYRCNGRMLLIDCGEGTQVSLGLAGFGYKALDGVCFTHYHADHTADLPGLLLTMAASPRREPVTLMGPPGLVRVVAGLTVISPELPYELRLIELAGDRPGQVSLAGAGVAVLPVEHRLPCLAYSLFQRRHGRFDAGKAAAAGVPQKLWKRLQCGETVETGGRAVAPAEVLGPERRGIKVSYCTDLVPNGQLPAFVAGSDLLVCEGLHGDKALAQKSAEKKAYDLFAGGCPREGGRLCGAVADPLQPRAHPAGGISGKRHDDF